MKTLAEEQKNLCTLKVEVPYSLVAFTVSGGTFVMFDINSSRKWQLCSRWVVFMITCTNWLQQQQDRDNTIYLQTQKEKKLKDTS